MTHTGLMTQLKEFSNPYRWDRDSHGSGFLGYIRNNIPSTLVKFDKKS